MRPQAASTVALVAKRVELAREKMNACFKQLKVDLEDVQAGVSAGKARLRTSEIENAKLKEVIDKFNLFRASLAAAMLPLSEPCSMCESAARSLGSSSSVTLDDSPSGSQDPTSTPGVTMAEVKVGTKRPLEQADNAASVRVELAREMMNAYFKRVKVDIEEAQAELAACKARLRTSEIENAEMKREIDKINLFRASLAAAMHPLLEPCLMCHECPIDVLPRQCIGDGRCHNMMCTPCHADYKGLCTICRAAEMQ